MNDRSRYTPLAHPGWHYVEKVAMEDFTREDWELLNAQRKIYLAERQADYALRMLVGSEGDPTFGYTANNYRHCLHSATLMLRDGRDEEDIVVGLLHDVGFNVCPNAHGDFAAAMLGAYISERNHWMLRYHGAFTNFHSPTYPGINPDERERWRDSPHFEWTAEFVDRYDRATTDGNFICEPIETFVPMVRRIFARTPVDRSSTAKAKA